MKLWHLIIGIVAIAVIALGTVGGKEVYKKMQTLEGRAVQAEVEAKNAQEHYDEKISKAKKELVYRLKGCESMKMKASDAPMILDTNNEMSIGLWMFQRDTVIYYYKKLYGKVITRQDAVRIAIDEDQAYQLTEDILFTAEDGWTNWANCAKKLGLAREIEVLKKVQ